MGPKEPDSFLSITAEQDFLAVFNRLERLGEAAGMSVVKQTQLLTATRELMTNVLKYAERGRVNIRALSKRERSRIEVIVTDEGPGIQDVYLAMSRGYSSGKTLGIGLPGAKALADEFDIKTFVGKGTIVTIAKWV